MSHCQNVPASLCQTLLWALQRGNAGLTPDRLCRAQRMPCQVQGSGFALFAVWAGDALWPDSIAGRSSHSSAEPPALPAAPGLAPLCASKPAPSASESSAQNSSREQPGCIFNQLDLA